MLPATRARLREGMSNGLEIGSQVYVSVDLEPVSDFGCGVARPGTDHLPPVPMTRETLMPWMSSGKPIVAVAVAEQVERGGLELDQPVAHYLPRFAAGGKGRITVRQVLTHTGGFRHARFRYPGDGWERMIEAICEAPLEPNWEPGEKAGYHVSTGWFILAELVRRVSGEAFAEYVRNHVFEPLGMSDSWIGMPEPTYRGYSEQRRLAKTPDTSQSPPVPRDWDHPQRLVHPSPASSGFGPVRELGRFYEMLLRGGEAPGDGGGRVLAPETVREFTRRQRTGLYDHTFKAWLDWGLGFIPDNKSTPDELVSYGYGPHASSATFGHSGNQSSVAFADPRHRLVVAVAWNGTPGEAAHQLRVHQLLGSIYEDLGLVP